MRWNVRDTVLYADVNIIRTLGCVAVQYRSLLKVLAPSCRVYQFVRSIDASRALRVPGVLTFLSAKDLEAAGISNDIGSRPGDEELWATTEVCGFLDLDCLTLLERRIFSSAGKYCCDKRPGKKKI